MYYQMENPHGGELYSQAVELDFSVNVNPLGAPETVRRAVERSAALLGRYPDPRCRELRAALARFEDVPQTHILCGNGAAELIFSYCAAARPKKALIPEPTFSEYEAALEAVGCAVRRFPLDAEKDFALTEGFLEELARTDADLVVLCNPNNPTGRLIPPALLDEILEVCGARGIRLFVDECFLDLAEGARSLKGRLADCPNLFLLKAFTKSFAMAGLRLGYGLCADGALLSAMSRTVQPWNVSLPAQLAGTAALEDPDFLPRARRVIAEQRPALARGLSALGLRVVPSDANFLLFWADRELKQPLLDRGILIRDCSNFPGLGAGWYRPAVKLPQENARLLAALKEVLYGV